MRPRFEFSFHTLAPSAAALADVDPTLALLGAQGWELRSTVALADGTVLIALQRTLDDELPLPDASTLSSALAAPLSAPTLEELAGERQPGGEGVGA
jgi:hypothetical protein